MIIHRESWWKIVKILFEFIGSIFFHQNSVLTVSYVNTVMSS